MKKSILFIVLICFCLSGVTKDFYPEKAALKAIKTAIKSKNISIVTTVVPEKTVNKNEPVVIYKCVNNDTQNNFFAVFTQAMGRYELFDYVIIADTGFSVEAIKIVKYRSEYGGEIASKKWLSQFKNYSDGELQYKKDISALSGASFSAPSLVNDVPIVLDILRNSLTK